MVDPLSPDVSPASPGAGVQRLNRWPIYIVTGVSIVAVCALVYAVMQRGASRPQTASELNITLPAPEVIPEQELQPVATPTPEDLFEPEDLGFAEIPAAPPEEPQILAATMVPEVYLPPLEPVISEIEQQRRDEYRAALGARTTVSLAMTEPTLTEALPDLPEPVSELVNLLGPETLGLAAPSAGNGQETTDPNLRARKTRFVSEQADASYPYSPHTRLPPLAEYELKVGTVMPAILITAINSDLPGLIVAQVSRHVRDTRTGKQVLIPAGSKLIGEYDSHVAFGQRRVLVVWRRVQFPDSSTMDLPAAPGVDAAGQSGLQDQVDNHYWKTFGGATLLSIIGAGAQLSQADNTDMNNRGQTPGEALSAELGRTWSTTSQKVIEKNIDVQPTLAIRAGFRFSVVVNQDIILDPYGQL